jgi:hypothetical protein
VSIVRKDAIAAGIDIQEAPMEDVIGHVLVR